MQRSEHISWYHTLRRETGINSIAINLFENDPAIFHFIWRMACAAVHYRLEVHDLPHPRIRNRFPPPTRASLVWPTYRNVKNSPVLFRNLSPPNNRIAFAVTPFLPLLRRYQSLLVRHWNRINRRLPSFSRRTVAFTWRRCPSRNSNIHMNPANSENGNNWSHVALT